MSKNPAGTDLVISGVRGIAKMLGISTATAQALIKRPDFPCFRVGKRVFMLQEDFKAWARNGGTITKGA